jgi:hypothetical protein
MVVTTAVMARRLPPKVEPVATENAQRQRLTKIARDIANRDI